MLRFSRADANVEPTYEPAGTSIIPLIPFTEMLNTFSPGWADSLKTLLRSSLALAPVATADVALRPLPSVKIKSVFVEPTPRS